MHRRRQRPLGAPRTERQRPGDRRSRWAALCAIGACALPLAAARPSTASGTTERADRTPTSTTSSTEPAVRNRELLVRFRATGQLQRIKVGAGQDPVALARTLRRHTDLFTSVGANLIAHASDDPTTPTGTTPAPTPAPMPSTPTPIPISVPPSAAIAPPTDLKGWIPNDQVSHIGWTSLQWNFVGPYGVNAPRAWELLRARTLKIAGGRGVKVAVIDSGIAYRDRGPYRRATDIDPRRVLPGYDFVDQDRFPDDQSGHGTHVASTIAGWTDNSQGLTGIAYNASILPVRVLDDEDSGDVLAIARGIKYAIRRKVDLINLSVDFPVETTAADVPEVIDAVDAARRAGILVISSSGNDGTGSVAYPARAASVLAVGATTVRGCRSTFSNAGRQLALVAPGGGGDHSSETRAGCAPGDDGPPIEQVTLMKQKETTNLGIPLDFKGTSMAAAHVTGIAALVLGSRIIGRHPSPDLLAAYLVRSTRDLGAKGPDSRYGAGLIDAAKAVDKRRAGPRVRGAERAVATAARKNQRALPIR